MPSFPRQNGFALIGRSMQILPSMKTGLLLRPHNTLDFFERAKRDDFSRPPSFSDQRAFQDQLRQMQLAEDAGFDTLWLHEEHFSPAALTGSPLLLATACAARTRSIGIGVALSLGLLTDPLAVGEGLSLLDNLLADRELHIAIAPDPAPHECVAAGLALDSLRERRREALQILRALFADEWLSHKGRHWSIPPTAVRPRPVHADLPQRMLVCAAALADDPALLPYAAGLFHSAMSDVPPTVRQADVLRRKRATQALPWQGCAVHVPVYCSERPGEIDAAREWWAQAFDAEVWHHGIRHHPATRATAARAQGRSLNDEIAGIYETSKGSGIFGSPAECRAIIARMRQALPIGHLIAHMHFGLMPIDLAERSIGLFAEQVMPDCRGAPPGAVPLGPA